MVYLPPFTNTAYLSYTNNGNNTLTTSYTHHDSHHAMSHNCSNSSQTSWCYITPITNYKIYGFSAHNTISTDVSPLGTHHNFFLPLPDLTAQQLHQLLTQSFPANIRRAYPWGFRKQFHTPHGVVFLKQKKSWRKGRTVISYFKSIAGTLLRATSKALDIMLLHLLPQHPGQLSIPNLWQQLHNHFQTTPDDIHLTPINDDLVGFFNSVPQQRLVDAVISLCNRWKAQHATTTITIDVQSTGNPIQHSHIGRHYIHHPQQRTLDTQHIPLIVQQALQSCIFQACNTYYKQIQGAGIGSQLSPALCNVAITLIEHTWKTTYHTFLHQPSLHLLNTRYVDNRYIPLNEQYRSALPITTLAHPEFYEHPVEIEPVDDDHLLGFLIDPLNRTVTFLLPTHPWQIRDPQSAGSHRLRLSGLQSRHHTLQKYTYPQHLAPATAQQLTQLYVTKGHSKEHCAAALRPRGKDHAPADLQSFTSFYDL